MTPPPTASPCKTTHNAHISCLVNSLYYFLDCVFIIIEEKQYRLLAIRQDRIMADLYFPTLRGAKISFARIFRTQAWQKKMKPQWTPIFPPDDDWMEEKLKIAAKGSGAQKNQPDN